jgi:hypothetical protein
MTEARLEELLNRLGEDKTAIDIEDFDGSISCDIVEFLENIERIGRLNNWSAATKI